MPKVIIVDIPMMYHCILHVQSISLTSAASTVLILCITMFVTKAFNLDCPYITYFKTSVIIRVKSHKVFGALSRLELISKVHNERGRICSWVVQFCEIGIPNSSIISSK